MGRVVRPVLQALDGRDRRAPRLPGAVLRPRPGRDRAVHAARGRAARGGRGEARRRGDARGAAERVLRRAAAGRDLLLHRRGQRAGQRPAAAALRAGRALRDRHRLRDRADLRPAAGHRRAAGARGVPAARRQHRPDPAVRAAGDADRRGRPGALGGPRRGDGLPRLRADHHLGPAGPADHLDAGRRGDARRLPRPLRAARRDHRQLARPADAAGRRGHGLRRDGARRAAHRPDPLPPRPVGAARDAGRRLRCDRRDPDVLAGAPRPGADDPVVADPGPAGAAAGLPGHPHRDAAGLPGSPAAAPGARRTPTASSRRRSHDRAGPGERDVRRRRDAGALRRRPVHPRGRDGAGDGPHRQRQVHAAARHQRAGAALLRRHPGRARPRRRARHRHPPAARHGRPRRLRRPGPDGRVRHRQRGGRARLRHGVARPRARGDAQARRGDPRPARPRRAPQPAAGPALRRAAAAGRDRCGADHPPAGAGARRADLGAGPAGRGGGAVHAAAAGPRPRPDRGARRAPARAGGAVRRPDRARPGRLAAGRVRRPRDHPRDHADRPSRGRARPRRRLVAASPHRAGRPPTVRGPARAAGRRTTSGARGARPQRRGGRHPRPGRRLPPPAGAQRRHAGGADRRDRRRDGAQRRRQVDPAALPGRPAQADVRPGHRLRGRRWCRRSRPTCCTPRPCAPSA